MTDSWALTREAVRKLVRKNNLNRSRRVRGLQRLDLALVSVLVTVILAATAATAVIVFVHEKYGLFDPPPITPVPDDRKIANIRNHSFSAPFTDIAITARSRELLAIRRDGVIHRLDLETQLWSEESLGVARKSVASDLVGLASECSDFFEPEACLGERIWALSQDGGLAVREAGAWRSLISDIAWHGLSGVPVEHKLIRSASVSEDRRWVLFGAAGEGLGLFDLEGNRWISVDAVTQKEVLNGGDASVTRLLWARGSFWIGSEKGLAVLVPDDQRPQLSSVGSVVGAVLDLERKPDGSVLVLSEGPCLDNGDGCLSVRQFDDIEESKLLIGEVERDPALSTAKLQHVALQSGNAVTFGEAGVHSYDPTRRAWRTLHKGVVSAVLETIDGANVYAALPGMAIRISGGKKTDTWMLPGERIASLLFGPDRSVLALSEAESLYRLSVGGQVTRLHEPSSINFDIADTKAAGRLGDTLLLIGGGKAAIHDVRRRRYQLLTNSDLPNRLFQPGISLRSDGAQGLWALSNRTNLTRLSLNPGAAGQLGLQSEVHSFEEPPLRVQPDPSGAFILFKEQGPSRVKAQPGGSTIRPLVGAPRPTTMGVPVMADVLADGSLLLIDDKALWRYDFADRGWRGPFFSGIAGQSLVDFAHVNGKLYFVGEKGLLTSVVAGKSQSILGAGSPLPFGLDQLEDATVDEAGRLLLAGQGQIVAYSPVDRAIVAEWKLGGSGPIHLSGAINAKPIGRRGNILFVGARTLNLPGASGVSISFASDKIVTVQKRNDELFLAIFPQEVSRSSFAPVCYFGQRAPPNSAIKDATLLPDGRVAVLAGEYVSLYDPSARRWRRTDWRVPEEATRIRRLGAWLVTHSGSSLATVASIELGTNDSCAAGPIKLRPNSLSAKQISTHEADEQVGILGSRGNLDIWRNGQITAQLPAATDGPDPSLLSRVFEDDRLIFFLSPGAAWWYDTVSRQWSKNIFQGINPLNVETLDARRLNQGRFAVTLWMRDGQSLGGIVSQGASLTKFRVLHGLQLPQVRGDFSTFLDAAEWDKRWYFLFENRLIVLDPTKAQLQADLRFTEARQDRRLVVVNKLIGLEEGRADAATSLHLFSAPPETESPLPISQIAAQIDLTQVRSLAVVQNDKARVALWLIDQQGVARSCKIVPGRLDPASCNAKNNAPVQLDRDGLRAAYREGSNKYLLVMEDGLKLLDRKARALNSVRDGPPVEIIENAEIFFKADAWWILSRAGEVWRLDQSGRTKHVGSGIARLYNGLNKDAPLWAGFADGLMRQVDKAGRPLTIEETRTLFGLSVAPIGPVTALSRLPFGMAAIGADGKILYLDMAKSVESDLLNRPDAPKISNPLAVLPGEMRLKEQQVDGWWVQDNSLIWFIYDAACPEPIKVHGPDDGLRGLPRQLSSRAGQPERCAGSKIVVDLRESGERHPGVVRSIGRVNQTAIDFITDRGVYELRDGTLTYSASAKKGSQALEPKFDRSEDLRIALSRLGDGTERLDVPSLAQVRDEVQLSIMPLEKQITDGTLRREALTALNADWLRWRRDLGHFEVGDINEFETVDPKELVNQGRFLPDTPGRYYLFSEQKIVGINRHGHWIYPFLNNQVRAPSFRRADLSTSFDVAHGRLLIGSQSLPVEGGNVETDAGETVLVRDALNLREHWRTRSIRALFTAANLKVEAFGTRGFAFDRRLSIGWREGKPMILTPIGVVSASRFELFAPPPPDLGTSTAKLYNSAGDLYAHANGLWRKLTSRRTWASTSDPTRARIMAKTSFRTWSMQDSKLHISPNPGAPSWVAARANNGGFVADHLMGGAGSRNTLVLNTAAGTLFANSISLLQGGPSALIHATGPPSVAPVETLLINGKATIVSGNISQVTRWDALTRSWVPIADSDFLTTRVAVDAGGIFLQLIPGQWRAEVEMETLDGKERLRRPFRWGRNDFFPFDTARAIHLMRGDALAIGTDFGLRVLQDGNMRLIDISRNGRPRPVTQVGQPFSTPNKVVARGESSCVIAEGVSWRHCAAPIALDHLHLGATSYWRWAWRGGVEGRYLDVSGQPIGTALAGRLPRRFPQDAPRDLTECNGQTFALRPDGLVERYAGLSGYPSTISGLWPVPENVGDRLFCVRRVQDLGKDKLEPGLFLITGTRVHRFNGVGWATVSIPVADAVLAMDNGDLIAQWGRLRARRAPTQGWRIEHLDLDNDWRKLAWRKGRLAVDAMLGRGTGAHGRLWIATSAGLASFQLKGGELRIDPENFLIAPLDIDGSDCSIDRIQTMNGQTRRAPNKPGHATRLRCRDGRVFQGELDGSHDRNAFQPLSVDPFDKKTVLNQRIGAKELQWHLSHPSGHFPEVSVFFLEEEAPLIGGRFSFDEIRDLAIFEEDRVEQLSPYGWHRLDPTLRLGGMERWGTKDVRTKAVRRLSVSRESSDSDASLCLDQHDGESITIFLDGHREHGRTCSSYLGFDGLWVYQQDDAGIRAEASAKNGPPLERRLVNGRFADLYATGMPVSIKNSAGYLILLPTKTGATALDKNGRPHAAYRLEPNGAVAKRNGRVSYLKIALEVPLEDGDKIFCPDAISALTGVKPNLPLLDVVAASNEAWDFRFLQNGQPMQARLYCGKKRPAFLPWLVDVAVGGRARFKANAAAWPDRGDRLFLRADGKRLMLHDGRRAEVALEGSINGRLRRMLAGRSSFFIATDNEIYSGDIDTMLTYLHTQSQTQHLLDAEVEREESRSADPSKALQKNSSTQEAAAALLDKLPKETVETAKSNAASRLATSRIGSTKQSTNTAGLSKLPATRLSEAWTIRSLTRQELQAIQRQLSIRGYYSGQGDGIFGPLTEEAVRAYQRANGYAITGLLTRDQANRLLAVAGKE